MNAARTLRNPDDLLLPRGGSPDERIAGHAPVPWQVLRAAVGSQATSVWAWMCCHRTRDGLTNATVMDVARILGGSPSRKTVEKIFARLRTFGLISGAKNDPLTPPGTPYPKSRWRVTRTVYGEWCPGGGDNCYVPTLVAMKLKTIAGHGGARMGNPNGKRGGRRAGAGRKEGPPPPKDYRMTEAYRAADEALGGSLPVSFPPAFFGSKNHSKGGSPVSQQGGDSEKNSDHNPIFFINEEDGREKFRAPSDSLREAQNGPERLPPLPTVVLPGGTLVGILSPDGTLMEGDPHGYDWSANYLNLVKTPRDPRVRHAYASICAITSASVPTPPVLAEGVSDADTIRILETAYAGATERHTKKKCWAFQKVNGKWDKLLLKTAKVLMDRGVAPAAWVAFRCDAWAGMASSQRGKHPAPLRFVFNPDSVVKHWAWCVSAGYTVIGRRQCTGPLAAQYRARVVAQERAFRALSYQDCTPEKVIALGERTFPLEERQALVVAVLRETAELQASLNYRALRGEWLW